MFYHVTTAEGVIYETNIEHAAQVVGRNIIGARVREGSLQGLREKSRALFGVNWLRGPSTLS